MTSFDQIPLLLRDALTRGPQAVMQTAHELADPDLGLLVLYLSYAEDAHKESGRVLAIECGKTPESGVARACRAWLMVHCAEDLGIVHTLLGHFHRDLVEAQAWPSYLVGLVLDFIRRALAHKEPSVKAEVLSLLALAVKQGRLGQILHKPAALPLAQKLRTALVSIAEEDELEDLATVESYLQSEQVPAAPVLDSRALQRIVLDLEDAADRYEQKLTGLSPLLDFMKVRALLDDAGAKVARSRRPLQTLRVRASEAPTRLVEAMYSFGEAVVAGLRDPTFERNAPDYGLQLAWAPQASVPNHLDYLEDDARPVFDLLAKWVQGQRPPRSRKQLIPDCSPKVASAILGLLERLQQHKASIEVVLTDLQNEKWQQSVQIDQHTFDGKKERALQKQAWSAAQGQPVHVSNDQVPQANMVRQIFQVVDARLIRRRVTPNDIDGVDTQRQVDYYKHGARILGFLDSNNQPTSRARSILGVSDEQRLAITAVYFEDSIIGRAWREWAGKNRLSEVDPSSARDFLEACVTGLTGTTLPRRASTLRAWYEELVTKKPADGR